MTRLLISLWAVLCVAAAFAGGIGIVLAAAWFSGLTPDEETMEPPAPADLAIGPVPRCPNCGWIESKRKLPQSADAAAVYEYTVRMADGSSSTFEQALPASWRVGERLTVD
jgi:hypothetical protein